MPIIKSIKNYLSPENPLEELMEMRGSVNKESALQKLFKSYRGKFFSLEVDTAPLHPLFSSENPTETELGKKRDLFRDLLLEKYSARANKLLLILLLLQNAATYERHNIINHAGFSKNNLLDVFHNIISGLNPGFGLLTTKELINQNQTEKLTTLLFSKVFEMNEKTSKKEIGEKIEQLAGKLAECTDLMDYSEEKTGKLIKLADAIKKKTTEKVEEKKDYSARLDRDELASMYKKSGIKKGLASIAFAIPSHTNPQPEVNQDLSEDEVSDDENGDAEEENPEEEADEGADADSDTTQDATDAPQDTTKNVTAAPMQAASADDLWEIAPGPYNQNTKK